MNKRSRTLPGGIRTQADLTTLTVAYGNPSTGPDYHVSRDDYSGAQYTESEGHPFHSRKGPKGLDDVGGEFLTRRSYIHGISPKRYSESQVESYPSVSITKTYKGPLLAINPGATYGFPPSAESNRASLNKYGATAIARCAPGNPPANAVTILGELVKDGLPSLVGAQVWKSRFADAKKLATKPGSEEYLNYQFGIAPLISDIKSLSSTILNSDSILSQFERDAGKVVRRRYQFPTETRSRTDELGKAQAYLGGPLSFSFNGAVQGDLVRSRYTEIRRWFSGAFTYYLPTEYDSRLAMARAAGKAQQLLSVNLTPDTIWELTPWSWAVDWFSNAGDVIHNVQRFADGGLVMRYGYMMEHSIVTDTYTLENGNGVLRQRFPVSPVKMTTEVKQRVAAHPFGFGMTWEGLSSFQASILAALGISRK